MNFVGHIPRFALLGLAFAVAGCRHARTTPVAQTNAPSIATGGSAGPPPAGNPLSSQSQPPLPSLPPAPATDASKHAPKPSTHLHRPHRKPKTTPAAPDGTTVAGSPAPAPAVAASAAPAEPAVASPLAPQVAVVAAETAKPSPIGTLSTEDVASSPQTRQDTMQLIGTTENILNNIRRPLSAQEQETVSQIRIFLQKAKTALGVDDIDGAHTLATKAKVLLDELTRS